MDASRCHSILRDAARLFCIPGTVPYFEISVTVSYIAQSQSCRSCLRTTQELYPSRSERQSCNSVGSVYSLLQSVVCSEDFRRVADNVKIRNIEVYHLRSTPVAHLSGLSIRLCFWTTFGNQSLSSEIHNFRIS